MREAVEQPAETKAAKHPTHHFTQEAVTLSHRPLGRAAGHRLALGLERGQPLVDAAYICLGYRNKDGGVWVK